MDYNDLKSMNEDIVYNPDSDRYTIFNML